MDDINSAVERLTKDRKRLGWTTAEVASRVRRFSAEIGQPLKLTQQAVSKFETGKGKSIPVWMYLFALLTDILELPEHSQREMIEDLRRPPLPVRLDSADQPAPQAPTQQERPQQVITMQVVLPSERALARMFEGLLRGVDRSGPLDALALLLAQRLPIGLSQLQDLLPEPASAPAVVERAAAAGELATNDREAR
jgi:transcriptional regulator with XRE-family HTH domain